MVTYWSVSMFSTTLWNLIYKSVRPFVIELQPCAIHETRHDSSTRTAPKVPSLDIHSLSMPNLI